ncbi:MAG TPA: phosphoglycerate kinase [Patescibacteria group bacterium]|nr:phosphoglycerate kinase [Patescibacteria group bacterium]
MQFINDHEPVDKRVLLRVDFNVSLNGDYTIADDARIKQSLPTINLLLQNHNRLILVSHLGRPKEREGKFSLEKVAKRLAEYVPNYTVTIVNDFLTDQSLITNQTDKQILLLENIRFYEGEKKNDPAFARALASLADVFVNDAFGVCHREDASVVGIPTFLPSYCGLLLRKEIEAMDMILNKATHPFIAILAGAKISSKLPLIHRILPLVDKLLLGGGLANTLFLAQGLSIGKSICEPELVDEAKKTLAEASEKILLPIDALVGKSTDDPNPVEKDLSRIGFDEKILDIGSKTRVAFAKTISQARTIVWNGPVGYFENPLYRQGSKAICKAITDNTHAITVVGGGETLAAIAGSGELNKITHISTGGGAMLTYLEKGTLPGIRALL